MGLNQIVSAALALVVGGCIQTQNSVSNDPSAYAKDNIVIPAGSDPSTERFASARQVIRQNCLECHAAYGQMSESDFATQPTKHGGALVKPGLPDQSRLFQKLARAGGGGNMPQGRAALAPDDLAKIESWIAQMTWDPGAPTTVPSAPRVTPAPSTAPSPVLPSADEPRFAAALAVIQKNCKACHFDGGFAGFVTEAQFLQADGSLVTPGSLEKSVLFMRLSGTEFAGGDMPLGYAPLSKAELQTLRDWILNLRPRVP